METLTIIIGDAKPAMEDNGHEWNDLELEYERLKGQLHHLEKWFSLY